MSRSISGQLAAVSNPLSWNGLRHAAAERLSFAR